MKGGPCRSFQRGHLAAATKRRRRVRRLRRIPQNWIAGADTGWIELFPFCLICVNLRITPLCGLVTELDTLECAQIAEVSPDSYADCNRTHRSFPDQETFFSAKSAYICGSFLAGGATSEDTNLKMLCRELTP